MGHYLYLDTTYDVTIGILDGSFEWVDFVKVQGQKASRTLQLETHRLLERQGLELKSIAGLFTIAGPGFYTGLRLSEGFADVLKFVGIPHFSFYSFEVPALLGITSGSWLTKAYRGEYFVYNWKAGTEEKLLLPTADLESVKLEKETFIHSETAIDEKLKPIVMNSQNTSDLIRVKPRPVFETVFRDGAQKSSFYFRAPEDEFKVSV